MWYCEVKIDDAKSTIQQIQKWSISVRLSLIQGPFQNGRCHLERNQISLVRSVLNDIVQKYYSRAKRFSDAPGRYLSLSRIAPAYAAGWEQEPVHKYSFAVVFGIVGQQSVPFVFLLATAIAGTSVCLHFPVKFIKSLLDMPGRIHTYCL